MYLMMMNTSFSAKIYPSFSYWGKSLILNICQYRLKFAHLSHVSRNLEEPIVAFLSLTILTCIKILRSNFSCLFTVLYV